MSAHTPTPPASLFRHTFSTLAFVVGLAIGLGAFPGYAQNAPPDSSSLSVEKERFMDYTERCLLFPDHARENCLMQAQTRLLEAVEQNAQRPLTQEEQAGDLVNQINRYATGIPALYSSQSTYGNSNLTSALINSGIAQKTRHNGQALHSHGGKPVDAIANDDRFYLFFSGIEQDICSLVMTRLEHLPSITVAFLPESYYAERSTSTPVDSAPDAGLCNEPIGTLVLVAR